MNRRKVQEIREHWQQFRQQVAQTGDMLRGRSMPELTKELFGLYEETGNRLIYEDEYFERRRFLAVFGLLSIWYEREEDLRKLEEVIREICLEETWALPAHVNRQEKDWQRTVDLFACDRAGACTDRYRTVREAGCGAGRAGAQSGRSPPARRLYGEGKGSMAVGIHVQ